MKKIYLCANDTGVRAGEKPSCRDLLPVGMRDSLHYKNISGSTDAAIVTKASADCGSLIAPAYAYYV